MSPRTRTLALSLFLGAAVALLLIPRPERTVSTPSRAESEAQLAASTTATLARATSPDTARSAARAADAAEGAPTLSLSSLPIGLRLTEPRLLVLDPAHDGPQFLYDGSELRLAPGSARTVQLRSGSPGWVFVPDHVALAADEHGRFEVEALPRQVIELALVTPEPLFSARVAVTYEFKNGCCPERRSLRPVDVALQGGAALLEAPPIDEGRFRLEVSTPTHYLARSDWLALDPRGWSRVTLTLAPYDGGSGRVLARVVDRQTGRAMEGVDVTLFEELPGAPLLGLRIDSEGLHPQRDGEFDPDLLDFPVAARTDADGDATLQVRAPGVYRLAAWSPGHTEFLSEVIELGAEEERELQVEIERGASLAGQVRTVSDDPALAAVLRLSGVRLERDGTSYSSGLDANSRFRFQGLPAGRYLLRVEGVVGRNHESESLMPLLTREVELGAGDARELELALGSLAPGRLVAGSLSSGESSGGWSWSVVLLPADAAPESLPVQIARAEADGSFALGGVGEGEWIVAAMGRSEDGRSLAFARRQFTLSPEAPARVELALTSQGAPLELASSAPASEAREVQLEVGAADPLTRRMLEALPPLTVSVEASARYLGLPEVPLSLRVGASTIPAARGATVWIP